MRNFVKNKLILAVLCVVVGMIPLVAIVNTVESGKHMLKRELIANASILVSIDLEDSEAKYEDFKELSKQMLNVSSILPISANSIILNSYKANSSVTLKAVDSSYEKYAALKMLKGSFISPGHLKNNLNVAVIDDLTADELFGTTDVLGRAIETSINGTTFEATIIGICKRLDTSEKEFNMEHGFAYVPITMLDNNLTQYNMQKVILSIKGIRIEEASAKISHFLQSKGIIVDEDNIKLINQVDLIDELTTKNLTMLFTMSVLWFIVAITGLINFMLIEVEESKKYYGLLRFYGSTSLNIRSKVYEHAYTIALTCSAFSIFIGLATSFALCSILNISLYISIYSITIGVLLPIFICMIGALYPAFKAARTDVNSTVWQLD
jgi:putative ABC transport system permease protein